MPRIQRPDSRSSIRSHSPHALSDEPQILDNPAEKQKHLIVGYKHILGCVVGGLVMLALIGTML